MSFQDWVRMYPDVARDEDEVCPECGSPGVCCRLVGDSKKGLGFAVLWCRACKNGVRLSRVRFPVERRAPVFEFEDPGGAEGLDGINFLEAL